MRNRWRAEPREGPVHQCAADRPVYSPLETLASPKPPRPAEAVLDMELLRVLLERARSQASATGGLSGRRGAEPACEARWAPAAVSKPGKRPGAAVKKRVNWRWRPGS